VAHLVPHPLIRQLRPDSPVVTELRAPARGCRTRFIAFYSDIDHLIVPSANGRVEHPDLQARNILAPGVGHTSLPVRGRIVHQICTTLVHLAHAGLGASEKVTSITQPLDNPQVKRSRLTTFTTSVRETFGPR
jgi:hypothetical protein